MHRTYRTIVASGVLALAALAALAALVAPGGVARAHTLWLEPIGDAPGRYVVKFGGHGGREEGFPPAKLKSVDAIDTRGRALAVCREDGVDGVTLAVEGAPAIVTAYLDNGIHARPPSGPTVEKPMDEVPGATRATLALKYHKTVARWAPIATRPRGQPFEVVPASATPPVPGCALRFTVLENGVPVAGVHYALNGEPRDDGPASDARGTIEIMPVRGSNRLWVTRREPVDGNPHYTERSYEYLLAFDAS